MWTHSQRRALVLLLSIFTIVLVVRLALNRQFLSDDPDVDAPRAMELADRFDPNIADWQTLAAIPMLGQNRAREIVEYRKRFATAHAPGMPAFRRPADLLRIKGIGASMVSNLEPYLLFPHPAPPMSLP